MLYVTKLEFEFGLGRQGGAPALCVVPTLTKGT
jgi:hypothetical protein